MSGEREPIHLSLPRKVIDMAAVASSMLKRLPAKEAAKVQRRFEMPRQIRPTAASFSHLCETIGFLYMKAVGEAIERHLQSSNDPTSNDT
ncbi:MAG: hypothetical protein KDB01_26185 [Planctomycetaceae bacterium]|nr:hypothetical protein [Planctomycetaceae bacterium]